MDFIIEFIVELFIEGSVEIGTDKRISKFIRYPLLILVLLFYIAIIGIIVFVGIGILAENIILGIIMILIAVFLVFITIFAFRKKLKEKNDDSLSKRK